MDHSPTLAINFHYVLECHAHIWHSQTPQSSALESEAFCLQPVSVPLVLFLPPARCCALKALRSMHVDP